uniref:Spermidine synthase n=1 Tax=Davidia involucrata TaxID=16924 RepID=A0A5B7BKG4_DAVIN
MKSVTPPTPAFISYQIKPLIPHSIQISRHSLSPTPPNLTLPLKTSQNPNPFKRSTLKSQQTHISNPQTKTQDDDDGIPIDLVKTLVKFKSRHNYIRVLQVSRNADHPFAGSRLLLLDAPGNIHSISFLFKSLTTTYFDVFATLPPILPPGPLGILGFGAGSASRLILELYPQGVIHGWELDPAVISVAREYFGLSKLEKQHPDRLYIYIGNALNASVKEGFSGILVDLFSKGSLIPELQDPSTWEKLKKNLRKGGRIMVNVGGSCVEAEDSRRDGKVIMEESLQAMHKVFPGKVFVLRLGNRKDDSSIALTGELPDIDAWKQALPRSLRFYVDMWAPFNG